MIEVKSEVLGRTLKTNRMIAELEGDEKGPVFIFTAGLHGNEPSGVFALKDVFEEIKTKNIPFHGRAIALAGNMQALSENKRYISEDLNRIWTAENIEMIRSGYDQIHTHHPERKEMSELYRVLNEHFSNRQDKEFFLDLHTTSAPTIPFIALSDMHGNLDFGLKFQIPVISNIDRFVQAPMLAYANHTGKQHVSMAFEAGQHGNTLAYENHKNFIRLALIHGNFFTGDMSAYLHKFTYELGEESKVNAGSYRIVFHYLIAPEEQFEMKDGYSNFHKVKKGEHLANSAGNKILCPCDGFIFMPLYQKQGDDGFFVVERVTK